MSRIWRWGAAAAGLSLALLALAGFAYAAAQKSASPSASSGGGDQYRPGFGWGDPNQNHAGPPALARPGGGLAPPTKARPVDGGQAAIVVTRVRIDEQALLLISVTGPGGKRLLITQDGSRIGSAIDGPQTKSVRYRVTVPRTIPIKLRIPLSLLAKGRTYVIRVRAIDPSGKSSTLEIPFRL